MLKRTLPATLRQEHPLVRYYLRKSDSQKLKHVIFGSSIGLFLMFGGLSLPMLYLLLSLVILLQLAVSTVSKIHHQQTAGNWDLIRAAPFSQREILLSAWGAGVHQLRQTWTLLLYQALHGLIIIGGMVFLLASGELPVAYWPLILLGCTALIAFRPLVEMYFSGMVGLLCAGLTRDHVLALTTAVIAIFCYWLLVMGGALLVISADLKIVNAPLILAFLSAILFLPLCFGYAAQRLAERIIT